MSRSAEKITDDSTDRRNAHGVTAPVRQRDSRSRPLAETVAKLKAKHRRAFEILAKR